MNWRDKKFGRLTGGELEAFIQIFDEIWQEREDWKAASDDPEHWVKSVAELMKVPNWTIFYQDSLQVLIAKIAVVAGFSEQLVEAANSEDPAAEFLKSFKNIPEEAPDHPAALPLAFAMIGNLDAIARYSRSINDMIEQCKSTNDVSPLFDALSIDSAISTMPFFQAALRLGQLSEDPSSAEEIFRRIKGPHKKRLDLPKLRWAEYLLRDQGAFETCTREDIYELCVEHLKVYDPSGTKRDAKAALFSRFRTWQKEAGI